MIREMDLLRPSGLTLRLPATVVGHYRLSESLGIAGPGGPITTVDVTVTTCVGIAIWSFTEF